MTLKDPLGKELAQVMGYSVIQHQTNERDYYMLAPPGYSELTPDDQDYVKRFAERRAKRTSEDDAWNDFPYETDDLGIVEHLTEHTRVVVAGLHFNVNVGWSAIVNGVKQFVDDEPSIAFVKAWIEAIKNPL